MTEKRRESKLGRLCKDDVTLCHGKYGEISPTFITTVIAAAVQLTVRNEICLCLVKFRCRSLDSNMHKTSALRQL